MKGRTETPQTGAQLHSTRQCSIYNSIRLLVMPFSSRLRALFRRVVRDERYLD